METQFQTETRAVYDKIKADATKRLTTIPEARDIKALDDFKLVYASDYRNIISTQMRQAYDFAKNGASDELKVPAPPTNRETTALINQSAASIAEKQLSDLLFTIKAEVLKELRKNTLSETVSLGLSDILGAIGAAFGDFFDSKILLTGAIIMSQSVNRGRDDVFESHRDDISVYQYSAILDERTCPICADLDGSTVDYADYRATKWVPPIHANCRCIFVGIGKDQTEQPAITGFPVALLRRYAAAAAGGVTDPSL